MVAQSRYVYNFMNGPWGSMAIAYLYTNVTNLLMVIYWGTIDFFVSVVADIGL